MTVLVCNLTH